VEITADPWCKVRTWFVIEDPDVWGRSVAVAEDGALLGTAGSVLSTYTLDGAFTRPARWGSLDGQPKMLAYTCSVRLTSNCSAFS
jgi:hypothetical protein